MAALHARAIRVPRPWSTDEFTGLLASKLVFFTGGDRAFALGRVVADEAELLTIVTDPNHRRQGLGCGVLADFEAEARRRGAERAFLEVAANNTAALALYGSAGFVETARRPGYYATPDGQPLDAILMVKALK